MASKVNVKFVAMLSAVLGVVLVALLGTAYFVLTHSAAELEALGDRAMAEKDYKNAITYYGKAYASDQSSIPRLTKYRDAMMAYTPENQSLYSDYYWKRLLPAIMVRSSLLKGDVAAQTEVLETLYRNTSESGFNRRNWEQVIQATDSAVAPFEAAPPADDNRWQRLKRYRGLALLEIATNGLDLDDDQAVRIESDLRAALEADPDDEQSALGLVNWYTILANQAASRERTMEEAERRQAAERVLGEFRARHPDSVLAALTALGLKIEAAARAADPKKFRPEQRLKMMREATSALEPELAAVFPLARRAGPDAVDANTLFRLDRIERIIRDNKDDESLALISEMARARPDAAELRFLHGRLCEQAGRYEDAIAEYDAILALPIPPLSLDGVVLYEQRRAALGRRASAAMAIWESIVPVPLEGEDFSRPEDLARAQERIKSERAAALARVGKFRDELAAQVPPTDLDLLLLNAKIAYASGNLSDAKRLIDDHVRQTGESDPDSVRLAGIVALQLNQPGLARDRFKRLSELEPSSPRAKLLLADVEGQLENYPGALAAYDEVLTLDPDNAYAKEKKRQVLIAMGQQRSDDPTEQALIDADVLWNGRPTVAPDRDRAVALLEQVVAKGTTNPMPYHRLTYYYFTLERTEEAKAACQKGMELAQTAKNDDLIRAFATFQTVLDSPDAFEAAKKLIDQSPGTPVEKLIATYRLAARYDRQSDAAAALAEARRLEPDNPGVVEISFSDALAQGRLDDAAALADKAVAADIDRVKGATYKARLLVARGGKANRTAAIEVLREAAQKINATPELWRFLGQIQADSSRPEDALASFNEALRMRPNDSATVVDTLKVLIRLERLDEALNLARKSETTCRANPEFRDLWLRLEGSVGDKAMVVNQRLAILKAQPDNDANKLALLQTLIDVGDWPRSRALLDELRKKGDSLLLVQLDAKWNADQGYRDRARQLFLDYIAAQKASGAPAAPEPYVAMANFLREVGDVDGALAALEEARKYQDPKRLEVDRAMGLALAEDLHRYEQALPILENFLKSGAPDDYPYPFTVRSSYVQALIRLGRYEDAERAIDQAGPEAADDLSMTLLRAGARQGQGDVKGAMALIDSAIAKHPNEALGYVKRAELSSANAESLSDAISDLDTALRIRPDLWSAIQLRAVLKLRLGYTDDAMTDLRSLVKSKPELEGPRAALFQALVSSGKFDEAVQIGNLAANQRPRDKGMLMSMGDFFCSLYPQVPQALDAGLSFYRRAWELGPDARVAVTYTRALLRARTPNLPLVERILATKEINTPENPQLLMNRAILLQRQGATDRSRAEAAQALRLVINSPGDTSVMLDQLAPVFGDPFNNPNDMSALVRFVQALDMTGLPDLWPDFFRARYQYLDPRGRDDATRRLREVVATAQDPVLQRVARQFLSAVLIGGGEAASARGDAAAARSAYEEALDVINGALKLDPDNAEALNNAAFVLAHNLERPEDALPLSERAVSLMPNAGPFLDTLGLIYLQLGRLDDADKALNRALALGGSTDDRLQIGLRLIRVKIQKKDASAAQTLVDSARKATAEDKTIQARYATDLDSLQREIDALR